MNQDFSFKKFFRYLIISALPVILALVFGFYDFYVKDIEEGFLIIILPIVFSPLYLGVNSGLNFPGLFWGCCLWMGLVVTGIMIFG